MKIELEQVLPSQIEARSFEIIGRELEQMGKVLDPEQEPVIKRCIHTTADFEYADSLVFSDRAVEQGLKALKAGAHIVTDTRMGFSGVNKGRLEKLGGEALCFMADPDVAEIAAREGCTRATASMDKAAGLYLSLIHISSGGRSRAGLAGKLRAGTENQIAGCPAAIQNRGRERLTACLDWNQVGLDCLYFTEAPCWGAARWTGCLATRAGCRTRCG